jgi:hypothetical protein
MKEIIDKVQQFLNAEYELNKANYLLDDPAAWERSLAVFRAEFLTDNTKELWFKIPVENFDAERRKQLMERIAIRKIYVVKKATNDIINVFASFPDHTDDLRNCLVYKLNDDELKLLSIENVCENCFGTGYVKEKSKQCNRCQGKGFEKSKTVGEVNWKTLFTEPPKPLETLQVNLPLSDIQKEVISMQ